MLFPNDDSLQINRQLMANLYAGALWAADAKEWKERLQLIHQSLSDVPETQTWFAQTHLNAPFRISPPARLRSLPFGFDGDALHLDGRSLGIDDIAKAVSFCSNLLGVGNNPIVLHPPNQTNAQHVRELENQVATYRQAAEERLGLAKRLHGEAEHFQKQLRQRGLGFFNFAFLKKGAPNPLQDSMGSPESRIEELESQVQMYRKAAEGTPRPC